MMTLRPFSTSNFTSSPLRLQTRVSHRLRRSHLHCFARTGQTPVPKQSTSIEIPPPSGPVQDTIVRSIPLWTVIGFQVRSNNSTKLNIMNIESGVNWRLCGRTPRSDKTKRVRESHTEAPTSEFRTSKTTRIGLFVLFVFRPI